MPELAAEDSAPARGAAGSREEQLSALGLAFRHAYRSLRSLRGRDTHLRAGEIGHAQFELLAELYERGPLSATELAAAAGLSAASVSQMLDHLAAEGQVERVRSDSDRRVVVTKLTRRGRRRVEARRALWGERWKQALEGVDAEELRIAGEVLERIGTVFAEPLK
ncbi:MAG: MarR family winged helix-turn-helix transcriptional regulator [Solirubrobacterales bacterium]